MSTWQAFAKNQFDAWSAGYDRSILQWLYFRPSHQKVFETISIPPGARVLDVGCGTGQFAARLLQSNLTATLVGLDLCETMLARAKVNCAAFADRLELIPGDSESPPFEDATFDLVTCMHSFHHYPRQRHAIREMYRMLAPQGQLVIVDANPDYWWGRFVFDWVITTVEGMVHYCTAKEYHELYREVGLAEVRQYRGGRIAPFLIIRGVARKASAATADDLRRVA